MDIQRGPKRMVSMVLSYYMGEEPPEDERQIKRWKAIQRHISAIEKNCKPLDLECRKRQRQAVLHWAYDSRKILVNSKYILYNEK